MPWGENDPLQNISHPNQLKGWETEKRGKNCIDSNHSPFFFLNLPKRNGADHLIFPPELSVPMEMISTPGNSTPGYKWRKSSRPAKTNHKLNSHLIRRLQDSNPGHIDSNARHKYWLCFLCHTLLSMYHFLFYPINLTYYRRSRSFHA